MKGKEGITLIALIITIIVMLILVGVTINVALNGGVFDKAKTAREDTQKETDKEQLLAAVIGTLDNDGKVYFGEEGENTGLDNNLPEGFEGSNGTYTNKNTGKKYKVDSVTGKVTEATDDPGNNISTEAKAYGTEVELYVVAGNKIGMFSEGECFGVMEITYAESNESIDVETIQNANEIDTSNLPEGWQWIYNSEYNFFKAITDDFLYSHSKSDDNGYITLDFRTGSRARNTSIDLTPYIAQMQ